MQLFGLFWLCGPFVLALLAVGYLALLDELEQLLAGDGSIPLSNISAPGAVVALGYRMEHPHRCVSQDPLPHPPLRLPCDTPTLLIRPTTLPRMPCLSERAAATASLSSRQGHE